MRIQDRWYNRIPRDALRSDILKNRHIDHKNFVDPEFCKGLQTKQQNECHHCGRFMDWIQRRKGKDGLTLERLNNELAHHKGNVVLCCKSCNSKKLTRDQSLLRKYFNIWYRKTFGIISPKTDRRCSFA
jgi:hypothetical protein